MVEGDGEAEADGYCSVVLGRMPLQLFYERWRCNYHRTASPPNRLIDRKFSQSHSNHSRIIGSDDLNSMSDNRMSRTVMNCPLPSYEMGLSFDRAGYLFSNHRGGGLESFIKNEI